MSTAELFRALGDETRLEMVERLSGGKVYTISSLVKGLPLTRQGARKHLHILEDAKIVILKTAGRDTTVSLDTRSLGVVKKFIAKLELQWEKRLEALKDFVEKD